MLLPKFVPIVHRRHVDDFMWDPVTGLGGVHKEIFCIGDGMDTPYLIHDLMQVLYVTKAHDTMMNIFNPEQNFEYWIK